MDSYTVIVLIFGIIILMLLVILFFINRLISYRRRVENSLVTVSSYLEVRIQLTDQMIEFIEKNLEYEKSYLLKLKDVKKYIQEFLKKNHSFKNFHKNEKEFLHFTTLDKTYSFLKNNQEYEGLKNEALVNQDNLIYALDSYDKGVVDYNNYRSKKMILFISKLFRFSQYDCYNK